VTPSVLAPQPLTGRHRSVPQEELPAAHIPWRGGAGAGECLSGSIHGHSVLHKRAMAENRYRVRPCHASSD